MSLTYASSLWLRAHAHSHSQRNRKVADLPLRFSALTDSFVDEEVGVALSRLERGFKRLSPKKDSREQEARVADAKQLIAKEQKRLRGESGALRSQLRALQREAEQEELETIETSADEVKRYVAAALKSFKKAVASIAFAENKAGWEGWDNDLRVRAQVYKEELQEVQKGSKAVKTGIGALDLAQEPKVRRRVQSECVFVFTAYERFHTGRRARQATLKGCR